MQHAHQFDIERTIWIDKKVLLSWLILGYLTCFILANVVDILEL